MSFKTSRSIDKIMETRTNKVPKVDFEPVKDYLDDLVQCLETKLCKPEEYIIHKGEESDYIFFVVSGKAEIYISNPNYGKVKGDFFEADEGTVIGEIGVVLNVKRTAFALAKNYTVLSKLSKSNFKVLDKTNRNFAKIFKKQIAKYSDRNLIRLKNIVE